MRLLIVGTLKGQLTTATKLAMDKGASVTHAVDIDQALNVLRSGRDGHWGLSGMRERAERVGARLRVWSRPAGGTEVELCVPAHIAFQHHSSGRGLRWLTRLQGHKLEHGVQKRGSEQRK